MLRTLAILALLVAQRGVATPEDADRSEEKIRASFVDQFTKFMQDKNVQGRPKTPDGKVITGGKKTRFNQDDGLAFQSDLTYHDYSFNTNEQMPGANGKMEEKQLHAFISPHGGISAAGGSSKLERTAYALDQKYAQQDKQNKNQPDQPGVKYRSIFKITTKQVFDQGAGGKQAGNNKQDGDKVERIEMRDEAKTEITKVGEDSFETIKTTARSDENGQDDRKSLDNGVYLRQAAYEATRALFYSTLANLGQRRMNRGIPEKGVIKSPQISEGVPKCEEFTAIAQQKINQVQDPQLKQKLLQDAKNMAQQCKQMAGVSFRTINPRFAKQDGGNEQLETGDVQKEDGYQSDQRLQLEIMAKAGKSVTDFPSNWQYTANDDKARVTLTYDDNGPKEGMRTPKETIESYNKNLASAEEGYQEVKSRLKNFNPPKPTDYAIQPGKESMMEINQPPASALAEGGVQQPKKFGSALPQNYNQLLQKAQMN